MRQNRFLQSLAIVALCLAAAITYGMMHDQVTARVCVEYFTIGHPDIFGTDDPTLLGLGWGIVATWWVGLPLGILLAFAAQAGRRPPLTARQLIRPLTTLLGVMACSALLAGIVGNVVANRHVVYLTEPLASAVPAARHVPFLTDLWAHTASYGVSLVGGLVLCVLVWRRRDAL